MMDSIDQAEIGIEAATEDAIRKVVRRCAPERDVRFDGAHCVEPDCMDAIPGARLKLGKIRCVDCQRLLEQGRVWPSQ